MLALIGVVLSGASMVSDTRVHRYASPPEDPIEIVAFEAPVGLLSSGDTATVRLKLRNTGNSPREVWIGYSVGAPNDEWYDIPSHRVSLGAGETSDWQVKRWVVSNPAALGAYRAVVGVWDGAPEESADAVRLLVAEAPEPFVVTWPGTRWYPADHALGRGRLRPESAIATEGGFRLALHPGGCDGAEIRTYDRYEHGTFSARMRTPRAAGSLSAIFLYEDVDEGNDEIDIEIFNDGSGEVLLTVWREGEITRQTTVVLPFDPSSAVHEYTIDRLPERVEFRIDGVVYAGWRRGMPRSPMRVAANVWWPAWLECGSGAGGVLEIEWIEITPHRADGDRRGQGP